MSISQAMIIQLISFVMGATCTLLGVFVGRYTTKRGHGINFHKAEDCKAGDGKCFAEMYHRDYEPKDKP